MSIDDRPVLLSVNADVATIRLNRPMSRNAISPELARAFAEAVAQIDARNDIAVVVLEAEGDHLCVGGDLKTLTASSDLPSVLQEMASQMHTALASLASMPRVVLAMAKGATAGGGLGLLLVADIVISTDTAVFVAGYPGVGLTPDCGVSGLLAQMIGLRRALHFTISNESVDAMQAREWGIVTTVLPVHAVKDELQSVIEKIRRSSQASGRTRQLVRQGAIGDLSTQLAAEAHHIVDFSRTERARSLISEFALHANKQSARKDD